MGKTVTTNFDWQKNQTGQSLDQKSKMNTKSRKGECNKAKSHCQ